MAGEAAPALDFLAGEYVNATTSTTRFTLSLGAAVDDAALGEQLRLALRGAGLLTVEEIRDPQMTRQRMIEIVGAAPYLVGAYAVDTMQKRLRYDAGDTFAFGHEPDTEAAERPVKSATALSFAAFGAEFPVGFTPKTDIIVLPGVILDSLPTVKTKPLDGPAVNKFTAAVAVFLLVWSVPRRTRAHTACAPPSACIGLLLVSCFSSPACHTRARAAPYRALT
jgi:hypothetical protein